MSHFHLQKYSGSESRHICPNCGRHGCFTYYVDDEGNIVSPVVGRCNHESSCGYHYTPREYFKNHPHLVTNTTDKVCKNLPIEKKQDYYIPFDYVQRSVRHDSDSTLISFLRSIISNATIDFLIDEYLIGVTNAGDIIWYQIDGFNKCHGGKIMKYDKNGHRLREEQNTTNVSWVHVILKKDGVLPKSWHLNQCLFGEHLLSKYPAKPVALVESEKTAIICAAFMPEYIWLATGGKSQLNDRILVLKGRKVTAFPDLDGYDEWCRRASKYKGIDIHVSSIVDKSATELAKIQHMDLADWVLEWIKHKDE